MTAWVIIYFWILNLCSVVCYLWGSFEFGLITFLCRVDLGLLLFGALDSYQSWSSFKLTSFLFFPKSLLWYKFKSYTHVRACLGLRVLPSWAQTKTDIFSYYLHLLASQFYYYFLFHSSTESVAVTNTTWTLWRGSLYQLILCLPGSCVAVRGKALGYHDWQRYIGWL